MAEQMLHLLGGERVLDVACGTGAFTRHFGEAVGPQGLAVGLDASATMLERAARSPHARERRLRARRRRRAAVPQGLRSTPSAASPRST